MKVRVALFSLLLFCLLVPAANAAFEGFEVAVACNNCTSAAMRQKAMYSGAGKKLVYNASQGTVRGYIVDVAEDGTRIAAEIPVTQKVRDAVSGLKYIYDQTSGSMKLFVNTGIPISEFNTPATSAYDLGIAVNYREHISDQLWNVRPTLPALVDFALTAVESVTGLAPELALIFTIVFEDGTTAKFEFTPHNGNAEYIENSLRTADGDLIPDGNDSQSTGIWAAGDLVRMRDHLSYLGARMSSSGSGTIIQKITCSFDGHTLHCVTHFEERP